MEQNEKRKGSELAKFVANKRKQLCLSQDELAQKVGCRRATISDFESEKVIPRLDTIEKILEVLGLNKFTEVITYSSQWDESKIVAKILKEKNLDPMKMTKREMYELTGFDNILLLKEIEEKSYEKFIKLSNIDERDTFNMFQTLVNFQLTLLKKLDNNTQEEK